MVELGYDKQGNIFMAKSKKSEDNKTNDVEARPQYQGKDPLAGGNTLVNPTNTTAETHYEVKERSEDVQASEIAGQNADERAEVHNAQVAIHHNVPNSDVAEQDEVAEGRVEPDGPDAHVDDTPDPVEVPDVSDEDQAKAEDERQDAMEAVIKEENK